MLRKDRQVSTDDAYAILDSAAYGTLAATTQDGAPYSVPLNFVREGARLYFHCAKRGRKLDVLRASPQVRICFVAGDVMFPEGGFTTCYASAIVEGTASEVHEAPKRLHALQLLSERFMPTSMGQFDAHMQQYHAAARVFQVEIASITGKRNAPRA